MMSEAKISCPQTRSQVISSYFLEHRAKLLDVAAFLDRLDRAHPDASEPDLRETALRAAIEILGSDEPQRVARILSLLSDHSNELPQSAHGMKGALGAVRLTAGGT